MDGNGRWANVRGLPRTMGHRKGVEAVREAVRTAAEVGYRLPDAVRLLLRELEPAGERSQRSDGAAEDLHPPRPRRACTARTSASGSSATASNLRSDILPLLLEAEETHARQHRAHAGDRLQLRLARRDRPGDARDSRAMSPPGGCIRRTSRRSGSSERLDTAGIPDPDLIIRTSGEERLSNFLLWQAAYAELMFIPDFWPDFTRETFFDALEAYAGRERRFGGCRRLVPWRWAPDEHRAALRIASGHRPGRDRAGCHLGRAERRSASCPSPSPCSSTTSGRRSPGWLRRDFRGNAFGWARWRPSAA